jgi:hypothetical protein
MCRFIAEVRPVLAAVVIGGAGCAGTGAGGPHGVEPVAQPVHSASAPAERARQTPGGAARASRHAGGAAPVADREFEAARNQHLLGVAGDDDAAELALAQLERLGAERPEAALVQAYLGSAVVLAAKRAWMPWNKGELAERGLRLLYAAVDAADPGEEAEVRFLRAMSSHPLPGFFGQAETAAADFRWLAERAESAVEDGTLAPEMAAAALWFHGEILEDAGDEAAAVTCWRRAAGIAPDSEHGGMAAERLR